MNDKYIRQLTDPATEPSDGLLAELTGQNLAIWNRIINSASESLGDTTGEWRYYKDGGQWLYKFSRKKKTIFWASVVEDTFRITFYFTDKADQVLADSGLPPALLGTYSLTQKIGALKPITMLVREQSDADIVLALVSIKVKIK